MTSRTNSTAIAELDSSSWHELLAPTFASRLRWLTLAEQQVGRDAVKASVQTSLVENRCLSWWARLHYRDADKPR